MANLVGLVPSWNPLDPVGSLAEECQKAYKLLHEWLSRFLASPPRYSDRGILPTAYQSSIYGAEYIVYYVLVLSIFVGVARFKGTPVLRAVIVAFVVVMFAPYFVQIVNEMHAFGDRLTEAFHFYTPPNKLSDPKIDNPIAGTVVFLGNGGLSLALSAIVTSYELVTIAVKFLLPLAYSISSIGERSKKVTEILVAIGLVATMFGRAFAQFFIDVGQVMQYTFPFGNTMIGGGIYIALGLIFAIGFQFVLVVAMYKGIQAIEGRMSALVRGTTVSVVRQTLKVDVNSWRKRQAQSVQPVYVVPGPQSSPSTLDNAKAHAAKAGRMAANRAAQGLSVAATAAGHPWVGAGVNAMSNKFFKD